MTPVMQNERADLIAGIEVGRFLYFPDVNADTMRAFIGNRFGAGVFTVARDPKGGCWVRRRKSDDFILKLNIGGRDGRK